MTAGQHKVEAGNNQIGLTFRNQLQDGVYYVNIQMEGSPEVSTHKVVHLNNNGNTFQNDDDDDDDDEQQE